MEWRKESRADYEARTGGRPPFKTKTAKSSSHEQDAVDSLVLPPTIQQLLVDGPFLFDWDYSNNESWAPRPTSRVLRIFGIHDILRVAATHGIFHTVELRS